MPSLPNCSSIAALQLRTGNAQSRYYFWYYYLKVHAAFDPLADRDDAVDCSLLNFGPYGSYCSLIGSWACCPGGDDSTPPFSSTGIYLPY